MSGEALPLACWFEGTHELEIRPSDWFECILYETCLTGDFCREKAIGITASSSSQRWDSCCPKAQ